jgi:hypothetical protein
MINQEGSAEFPYARADVFAAILAAVPIIAGRQVDSHDEVSGRIVVKSGVSLFSWGEIIPISLTTLPGGGTRVEITSTPKTGLLGGGAFDMGKNRKNVEHILAATSAHLKSRGTRQVVLASAERSASERLAQLKTLLTNGFITPEEYESKRKDIIAGV